MPEPSQEVLDKLEQATRARGGSSGGAPVTAPVEPPPVRRPKSLTVSDSAPAGVAPSGSATAKYVLLDHFFGGSNGTLWAYDGSSWRAASTAEPADEQGVAQVAFAANRVDLWWNDSNALTIVRSWKYL